VGIETEEVLGSRFKVQRSTEKMAGIKRFEEIEAWQEARELVKLVYEATKDTGFAKDYGLKGKVQRACQWTGGINQG